MIALSQQKQMTPQEHTQAICDWLAREMSRTGARGVVMRIDGDLDSAVAATLAQRVLGGNVRGLLVACHGSPKSSEDALMVVKHLGLPHETVDLSSVCDALLSCMPHASPSSRWAACQRLKMVALYHYAESNHLMVMGALNRSRWELGRFIKHGDDAAEIQPLLHLLQRDVEQLGLHLQLPQQIIEKPAWSTILSEHPAAAALGFNYRDLDSILAGDQVATDLREVIQHVQRSAFPAKQPVSSLLVSGTAGESDRYDQEIYDKSIEALTIISKAITSDQYLEDILRLIVMVTAEVMSSSVCSLWLLDEKEGVLRLRATQSINSDYLKDRTLKVGEGIVGRVVVENRPYIASNVLIDPHYKEKDLARRMGLVSMISVPMRVKDRVIGVINCYTSHPHVFSDLQINVFTAVASQAAVAIENTELMVKTKVIQEELESRKLIERAKDLIMKRFGLSGDEAYRWLQKRSMNSRKSMRQVAEAVLLAIEA